MRYSDYTRYVLLVLFFLKAMKCPGAKKMAFFKKKQLSIGQLKTNLKVVTIIKFDIFQDIKLKSIKVIKDGGLSVRFTCAVYVRYNKISKIRKMAHSSQYIFEEKMFGC